MSDVEEDDEQEAVLGYIFTHADCPNCYEPGEYEGDRSSESVCCTACDHIFRIREVR